MILNVEAKNRGETLLTTVRTFIIPFIQTFVSPVYTIPLLNFTKYSKQLAHYFWLYISALHTVAG